MPTMLSEDQKKKLLAMQQKDMSVSFITKTFTKSSVRKIVNGKITFVTKNPEFDLRALFTLKKGEYINTEDIQTSVGRFLFNKLIIENTISDIIPGGYYNKVFTKKSWDELAGYISSSIMEGKLSTENLVQYLKKFEFYGLKLVTCLSPSFDQAVLKPNPIVQKEKQKLLDELDEKENPTLKDYTDIEDKLINTAKNAIGKDPSMSLYDSGSRGNFDNDYKINTVIVGPVKNCATGGYDFMKSDMIEGLRKEDIPKAGNMVVGASYPKAVGTAVGGYMTKEFYAVYQSIVLSDVEDCGSKYTLKIHLTKDNVKSFMYQYMMEGEKKVCLTPDNASKYIGKTVHFRSPMGCIGQQLCRTCAGTRFDKLDIKNVGLTAGKVSNNLMNKQMKKFHEIRVKLDTVDPSTLLM